MIPRLHPREREIAQRVMLRARQGGFHPSQVGSVSAWLRLAASTQSGGEWTSIVDVLNAGNPVTQTDADRRAAVGTSANGLPTMVFDGTDMHLWPLSNTINNMATKLGIWFWFKPATVASVQRILAATTVSGASVNKFQIFANSAALVAEAYISGSNGRSATVSGALAAGAWHSIYFQYDSSRGGDGNIALYLNAAGQSPSFAALGSGGTLTTLPQPTGNILIGARTDSDTPTQAITDGGEIGPNIFALNDNLTADQIAALHGFERPT